MSSRGKRRGHRNFPQAVHTSDQRQEEVAPAVTEPPPLYPPLLGKPKPLLRGGEYDYMTTLREDLKERIRQAGYYMPSDTQSSDIERYSDKYQPWNTTKEIEWDKSLYPAELFETGPPSRERKKGQKKIVIKDVLIPELTAIKNEAEEIKIEIAEQQAEDEENGEDNLDEEEEEDEEDIEEGTDYAINYYDNDENNPDEAEDHIEDSQMF